MGILHAISDCMGVIECDLYCYFMGWVKEVAEGFKQCLKYGVIERMGIKRISFI
jgi:hypothetical protein